jgi:mono/diheme cytochrome c family protein
MVVWKTKHGFWPALKAVFLLAVWALPTSLLADQPPADTNAAEEFFETQIRPLLLAHCVECHGGKKEESGLRLDSRQSILKGNEEGPVVLLSKPDKSRLLRAVRHEGDIKMPPNGKLTDDQVAALEKWIRLGLPWPPRDGNTETLDPAKAAAEKARTHWAFQPVRMPELPPVKNESWCQSPIDRFVLARLEAKGISPSPPADRRTLIRRAYFDLIGLPPTAAEIAEFEHDQSPDAFAKVVDRLLASPHYGERWARYWLDVARYSDTKGYVFNEERNFAHAYNYRDWVVRSLNEDLPYDQFLIQQLAADCLPRNGDDRSLAAMGYLTLGRRFLNIKPDIIDDRLDVVFRGMLGLTVSCARCHDHKFDPIPTADYYSLYGVFDAAVEKQVPIEPMTPEFEKGFREHEREVSNTLSDGHRRLQQHLHGSVADYLMATHAFRDHPLTDDFDFVPFDGDTNPFFINRWRHYLKRTAGNSDPVFAPWHLLTAIPDDQFAARAAELAPQIEANAELIAGQRFNPLVARLFSGEPPKTLRDVAERYAKLLNETRTEWETALADAAKNNRPPAAALADPAKEQIRQVFYSPFGPTNVTEREVELLLDQKTKDNIAKLRMKLDAYAAGKGAPRQAMILEEIDPTHNPRIFVRGNAANPGAEVPRQFLSVLSSNDQKPFQNKSGRLELAQQIASSDNPLTARVFVNRVWLGHFGAPLVRTPSDFGLRSETPSHPELLDYLARRFIDDGWSVKKVHRLIMLSSTYQQSSALRPECAAVDAENRLLWRMNRRRLDFETTRDALLAAAGDVDLTVGGPAVDITGMPFPKRRTLYARIERQNLPGLFRAFDFASPDNHSPQRFTTTVPQQALFLLNGPFVGERAASLARRDDVAGINDPAARIRQIYAIVFAREPTSDELKLGHSFIENAGDETPGPSPLEMLAEAWQYGYGEFDEASGRVKAFERFPHFTGSQWQGGPALPDPSLGWAMLNAEGGHVGNDSAHAAIRRWVAPRDGSVRIEGTFRLAEEKGDGVRGRILSSRGGKVGEWIVEAKKNQQKTVVEKLEVNQGDMIDFIADLRTTFENDTFVWPVTIQLDSGVAAATRRSGSGSGGITTWDSAATFHPPKVEPLSKWARYAQVLLMSNEFVFVD